MPGKPSPISDRIVAHLKAHGHEWHGGAANACVRRTYAGRNQKAAGAWLWTLDPVDLETMHLVPKVGSCCPAAEVAAAKEVEVYEMYGSLNIDPVVVKNV